MLKKNIFIIIISVVSFLAFLPFGVEGSDVLVLPLPARIGGRVTVKGIQLTNTTDTGYTFRVTKRDGSAYVPGAEDTDGLSNYDVYLIDIPGYDAADQPGGAKPGDEATIHVYKDGSELTLTSPPGGRFSVGSPGSMTQIDLEVVSTPSSTSVPIFSDLWGILIMIFMLCGLVLYKERKRLCSARPGSLI